MSTTKIIALLAFTLITTTAEAEPVGWKSYAALTAGQVADGEETIRAFFRGCVESNPLLGAQQRNIARVAWTKTFVIGGTSVLMRVMDRKGHPKVAKVLGYFGGAVGAGAALYNSQQSCGGGR